MRRRSFYLLLLTCAMVLAETRIFSQGGDDPGAYMTSMANAHVEMNQKYMAYMSAAAHGRRAKKVEKLRQAALASITNSKYKTIEMPYYKGDNSLRQSSIDYIQFCYNVFNEDYNKIVNMEEIAEQSIDRMEAYILLQEKTSEKVQQAAEKINKASQDFAGKYNVKLIDSKDDLSDKMDKAGKVNHYVNQLFIIFFKCNFQDAQLVGFMNNKKVNDIEQSRNALLKYATDGLAELGALRTYEGDAQLSNACRQLLEFYKTSAEKNVPKLVDFYLKQDNFDKLKKTMESKSSRTKEDVDAYNAAVKDINAASNQFNQLNTTLNNSRTQLIQQWEDAQKAFTDAHTPYYKG